MFLKILDELLNENGLNKRQFSIKSGIPYTTIDGFYKKGYESIRLTTLRKIAEYFNVSLDYLIFGTEQNADNEQLLDMQKYYNMLNEAGKQKAVSYLEDLSGNPKYINKNSPIQTVMQETLTEQINNVVKHSTSNV